VKWRDEHYVPTNVEEHLQISMSSSLGMQMTNMALISLGNVTSREDVNWAFTFPKIIRGVCILGRVGNDIMSHEVYQISPQINFLKPCKIFPTVVFLLTNYISIIVAIATLAAGTSFKACRVHGASLHESIWGDNGGSQQKA
jgi:hypothetical protein